MSWRLRRALWYARCSSTASSAKARVPDALQVSVDGLNHIISIFKEDGTGDQVYKARTAGFQVSGALYRAVKADSHCLYGEGVRSTVTPPLPTEASDQISKETSGVVIVRTSTANILSQYSPPSDILQAARYVEQLADYLISVGL